MILTPNGSDTTKGTIIPKLSSIIGRTTFSTVSSTRTVDGSLSLVLVAW